MSIKRVEFEGKGDAEERAQLAHLIRKLPLATVLNISYAMLADRQDLDGRLMQAHMAKLMDITWPLVTVDPNDDEYRRKMSRL